MDKIYYAKAYDRNKNIQYFLSNTLGKSSVSCPLKPSDSAPLC